MCTNVEMKKEKYGASLLFFTNGVLFGIIWERLGTNQAWSYAFIGPMLLGVPIVIYLCWGLYSLFSIFLLGRFTKNSLYCTTPFVLSLFIEPCGMRFGFWHYIFLKGELLALLPYFVFGYLLITISFNKINIIGWKFISNQKNPVARIVFVLSCMFLFAIDGLFVYSVLSILYFKKMPIWLISRLLFD